MILFLLLPITAFTAGLELTADLSIDPPEIILTIRKLSIEPFLENIDQGLSSEIVYSLRYRKKGKTFFTTIFMRKNSTQKVSKIAKKDFLTSRYVIIGDKGRVFHNDRESFKEDFFSCRIPVDPSILNSGDYIIEGRASADLIKRPEPLSLLDPFMQNEKTDTGWSRLGS